MKIRSFNWDHRNIDHIAKHGVDSDAVEEVFTNSPKILKSRQGKYVALGQSAQGRYLFVVFINKGKSKARVITARDMTQKERRLYKK